MILIANLSNHLNSMVTLFSFSSVASEFVFKKKSRGDIQEIPGTLEGISQRDICGAGGR